MLPKPQFGGRVRVSAVYRRAYISNGRNAATKEWRVRDIKPRDALYIGYRTLSDGVSHYGGFHEDDGFYYAPSRHFTAALVVFSERERPVLVPLTALEVIEDV